MQHQGTPVKNQQKTPFWMWMVLPVTTILGPIILIALAIFSLPYFWLYPERHAHLPDFGEGTPDDAARLARWRGRCARLTFFQRVGLAWRGSRRFRIGAA